MWNKQSREIELNWFSILELKTSQPIWNYTGHHRDQQKPVKKGILRQLCWISPLLPALRSDAFFSFRPYFTILLSISQWCRVIHIAGSILMAFSSILNDMMKLCIYFRKCTAKLRLWDNDITIFRFWFFRSYSTFNTYLLQYSSFRCSWLLIRNHTVWCRVFENHNLFID